MTRDLEDRLDLALRQGDALDLTRRQKIPAENRDLARRVAARREREHAADETRRTTADLVDIITAGILVLRTRDGVPVSEEMARERACNLVTGILGAYSVKALP